MYIYEASRAGFKSMSVRFKNSVFFPIVLSPRSKTGFRGKVMNLIWDV